MACGEDASSLLRDLRYAVEDASSVDPFRVTEHASVRSVLESIARSRAPVCVHVGGSEQVRCWLEPEWMEEVALIVRPGGEPAPPWHAGDVATSLPGGVKVQVPLLAARSWQGTAPGRPGRTGPVRPPEGGRAMVADVLRERLATRTPGSPTAEGRASLWAVVPPTVAYRFQRREVFRTQPVDSSSRLIVAGVSLPVLDFSERGVAVDLPPHAPPMAVGDSILAQLVFDTTLYRTTVRVCWVSPANARPSGRAGLQFVTMLAPDRAGLARRSIEVQSEWRRRRG